MMHIEDSAATVRTAVLMKTVSVLEQRCCKVEVDMQWKVACSIAKTVFESQSKTCGHDDVSSLYWIGPLAGEDVRVFFTAPDLSEALRLGLGATMLALLSSETDLPLNSICEKCATDLVLDHFVSGNMSCHMSPLSLHSLALFMEDFTKSITANERYSDVMRRWINTISRNMDGSDYYSEYEEFKLRLCGLLLTNRSLQLVPDHMRLLEAVCSMAQQHSQHRQLLIKGLLVPLLRTSINLFPVDVADILEAVWHIVKAVAADLQSASLLICIVINELPSTCKASYFRNDLFWPTTMSFMLDGDGVVRKRGLFMMEQFHAFSEGREAGPAQERATEQTAMPVAAPRSIRSRKQRLAASSPGVLCKEDEKESVSIGEASSRRRWHWINDFLAAFKQLEGCRYIHLIQQVMGHVEKLTNSLYNLTSSGKGRDCSLMDSEYAQGGRDGYPQLEFQWIRALLQCLLRGQIIAVRKHTVKLILSGAILLHPSTEVVDWITDEVLQVLDSSAYYPSNFGEFLEAGGNTRADARGQQPSVSCSLYGERATKKPLEVEFPGSLLPRFLHRFIELCATSDEYQLLFHRLIRNIVHAVCKGRLVSLTSMKWIFCVFGDSAFQKAVLDSGPCLAAEDLMSVKSFMLKNISCVTNAAWIQISYGLIPLLLCSTESCAIGPLNELPSVAEGTDTAPSTKRMNLISMLISCDQWNRTVQIWFDVLRCALLRWNSFLQSAGEDVVHGLSISSPVECCLAASVLHDVDSSFEQYGAKGEMFAVRGVVKELSETSCALYSMPYLPEAAQMSCIAFVSTLTMILKRGTNSVVNTFGLFLVEKLSRNSSIVDVARYLCLKIKAILTDEYYRRSGTSASPKSPYILLENCSRALSSLISEDFVAALMQVDKLNWKQLTSSMKSIIFSELFPFILSFLSRRELAESISVLPLVRCIHFLAMHLTHSFHGNDSALALELPQLFCLLDLCQNVLNLPNLTNTEFRKQLNVEMEATTGCAYDYLNVCGFEYGKFTSFLSSSKWSFLRHALPLLTLPSYRSGGDEASGAFLQDTLDVINNSLELAPSSVYPDICSCCLCIIASTDGSKNYYSESTLSDILEISFNFCFGEQCVRNSNIFAFIRLAFDKAVLLSQHPVKDYFDRLLEMGLKNRPHVLQNLLIQLITVWREDPELSLPYFADFPKILMHREPSFDDFHYAGADKDDMSSQIHSGFISYYAVSRIMLLLFLDSLDAQTVVSRETLKGRLRFLIVNLLDTNGRDEYSAFSPVGSEKAGEKLRLWQALCILSRHVDESMLPEVLEKAFSQLKQNCVHHIRVHMEFFISSLLYRHPGAVLPKVLQELKEFNHPQQTLSSYFIVIGHCVESCNFLSSSEGAMFIPLVVASLQPWLLCYTGLPRTISQLLMYRLIPLLDVTDERYEALREIWKFLDTNKDCMKMRARQIIFFSDYDFLDKCTLTGLLSLRNDQSDLNQCGIIYSRSSEDLLPVHLLTVINDYFKEDKKSEESIIGTFGSTDALATTHNIYNGEDIYSLQTKRIPIDELYLGFKHGEYSFIPTSNKPMIQRQDIIVCASLVSKPTNLGGLARSCEVFGAKKMLISDLSVVKGDTFQGIAVSAASWLPIEEVPVTQLSSYLKLCRGQGFAIIGVEQTDTSVSLQDCKLPSKCLLLLGKEREGIPVELLQEVDICVEIPQLGVTRSLNVHVCASIVLWEYTAQNLSAAVQKEIL